MAKSEWMGCAASSRGLKVDELVDRLIKNKTSMWFFPN